MNACLAKTTSRKGENLTGIGPIMFDFPWLLMGGGGGIGLLFGSTKGETDKKLDLDALSDFLTLASLIPGLDTFTNLASIPVDLARGDYVSAGLSALGVIPFYGEVADTAKLAKLADKAAESAKIAKKTTNLISPFELVQTHKVNLSKKQFAKLVDSIRNNGVIETIKYIEYNGKKYVVDGHHRLRAAKQLGIHNIPVEQVSLPYKGYKTIKDLLNFD